jgi:hypothetical protein
MVLMVSLLLDTDQRRSLEHPVPRLQLKQQLQPFLSACLDSRPPQAPAHQTSSAIPAPILVLASAASHELQAQ